MAVLDKVKDGVFFIDAEILAIKLVIERDSATNALPEPCLTSRAINP